MKGEILASPSCVIKHPVAQVQLIWNESGASAEAQLVYFHVTLEYCPCEFFLAGKGNFAAVVINLWHVCRSQMPIIIAGSKRLAITALEYLGTPFKWEKKSREVAEAW